MLGEIIFLGTGGSAGIPMVGCTCSVCLSTYPKNQRMRPSALLKVGGKKILLDTGPDFRFQALRYKIFDIDGVLLTHTHYDHIAGLDELRNYYLLHKKTPEVLLSSYSLNELKKRFPYLFQEKKWGISLAAQLHFVLLEKERGETTFMGLPIRYMSYEQGGMQVTGFRFGNLAYISDIKIFPESIYEDLQGLDTLIVSALRESSSPMHFSFEEAIQFVERVGAKKSYFTHIAHEVEHESAEKKLPKGVHLSYDGLSLNFTI